MAAPPVDLHALCEELKQLRSIGKPNRVTRLKVETALQSKWEGVRVTAAQTLAAWGDEQSLGLVREVLAEFAAKPHHWHATGAIVQALRGHLKPTDFDWVIELWLNDAHKDNRRTVGYLFEEFPAEAVICRLAAENKDGKKAPLEIRDAIARAEWRMQNEARF